MKTRFLYILIGVLFCAGAILVGTSFYNIYNRKNIVNDQGYVSAELKRVRTEDLQVLNQGSEDESQIIKSLARYTDQNLPDTENLIKKYLTHENKLIRAAALEASGAHEWADMKDFANALSDKTEAVRFATLRGLAKRTDSSRLQLVQAHANKSGMTDKEWFLTQMALLKLSAEPALKEKISSDILNKSKNWDSKLKDESHTALFRALPNNDNLKLIAREELQKPQTEVATYAFQYLLSFDKEWLTENADSMTVRNDFTYQLILIDFLANNCPKGWSTLSEQISASPAGPEIIKHLDEARLNLRCTLGL